MIGHPQNRWESRNRAGNILRENLGKIKRIDYEVFCHPRVIVSKPHLIAYYRLISVLPQKGVQRLAIGIKSFEEKRIRKIDEKRALMVARVFNASISSMIDSDPDFTISNAHSVGMMNLGTQINGSWRNEIGMEGSRRVKELILKYFLTKGLVSSALSKDGVELKLKRLHTSIGDVQCITLKNKYMIEFGSEPDISLRTPKSVLEAAIEVKAGIDPAGALERYGAAKKSFDRALRENKAATTVYLASCITEGVRRAMSDDRLVKKEFNLTSIFVNDNARREFLEYIQWLAHL